MENENKQINKKTIKIVLVILIAAAIVAGGVIAGMTIARKTPDIVTRYGAVKGICVDSSDSFTLRVSAPYDSKEIQYVSDSSKQCSLEIGSTGKSYSVSVGEVKYSSQKNDDMQKGEVGISLKVEGGFSFEDAETYVFKMPDNTVTEKSSKTSVGEVEVKFTVQKAMSDQFFATLERISEYEIYNADIDEAKIEKEGDKYFLFVKVNAGEVKNLNEQGLKEEEAGVTYLYKEDTIKMVTVFDDITVSDGEEKGAVIIKCPIKSDDVIAGSEYVVCLSQELLVSDDKTSASGEMTANFTFMG